MLLKIRYPKDFHSLFVVNGLITFSAAASIMFAHAAMSLLSHYGAANQAEIPAFYAEHVIYVALCSMVNAAQQTENGDVPSDFATRHDAIPILGQCLSMV